MSDILARRFGSATDGVGVGVGIWRDSLPCARRIWRGAGLGEAGVARDEIEDPDESLAESVGGVGRLWMPALRCTAAVLLVKSPRESRFFAWSCGLLSVKTSSSCGDRVRDGRVVDEDLSEFAGAVLGMKGFREIGDR